jgi:hypothetical protein
MAQSGAPKSPHVSSQVENAFNNQCNSASVLGLFTDQLVWLGVLHLKAVHVLKRIDQLRSFHRLFIGSILFDRCMYRFAVKIPSCVQCHYVSIKKLKCIVVPRCSVLFVFAMFQLDTLFPVVSSALLVTGRVIIKMMCSRAAEQ